jgi:hypothetical protein
MGMVFKPHLLLGEDLHPVYSGRQDPTEDWPSKGSDIWVLRAHTRSKTNTLALQDALLATEEPTSPNTPPVEKRKKKKKKRKSNKSGSQPGLLTQGVPGVPQDPFAPRRGSLGPSPYRDAP